MKRLFLFLSILVQTAYAAQAQTFSYAFQTVTTAEGLTSGLVTAISQDKYGYIWIGTSDGLNRYDGYTVRAFGHQHGDSTSVLPSPILNIFSDSDGRLWVGFMHGLMEYDFEKNRFQSYARGKIFRVGPMIETAKKRLHIATEQGLALLETNTGKLDLYVEKPGGDSLLGHYIWDMVQYKDDLYLLNRLGIVVFNLRTEKARLVKLPACMENLRVNRLKITADGTVWLAAGGSSPLVFRTDLLFKNCKIYNDLETAPDNLPNVMSKLFVDNSQRLWALTAWAGLASYDPETDRFKSVVYNPRLPNNLPGNYISTAFQDQNGFIWLGVSGIGASYFHPDNNMFQNMLPALNERSEAGFWARSAVETPDGHLWLATGLGVYDYNPATGQFRSFQNQKGKPLALHHNSVRSLYYDRRGYLWIGTQNGVNRYHLATGRMEFLNENQGLPQTYYLSIFEDSQGILWFSSYQNGHYYILPGEQKAHSIFEHPVLKPYGNLYGRCMLEDSRGLLWFGLDGRGLICYDRKNQTARWWERSPENDTTLAGNFVYSIVEDHNGLVWASTSSGLSSIDPATFLFTNYDLARGLPANRTTGVLVDPRNRLWIGTSQGLLLLDSARRQTRLFNTHDGLPANEFSDVPATRLRDGRFLFSTRRGFVLFDPNKYNPRANNPTLLLSSVRVFNQPFAKAINSEALTELYLPPGQNFFSLEITALHYRNPRQTWYAYRLEPYERHWTYTRERLANYTNVPAGNYTFRYKATIDPNNWDVPEKTLRICVGQHWYLSGWFWGLVALALIGTGGWFALRRIRYRRALLNLERKAQALAKEKAQVQYENLTQQLNPHFLFNSLASLGSLIRFEPQKAGAFLEALSKMYRYMLQSPDNELVQLEAEITFVENFVHLQQTRFGTALQVNFNIEPALLGKKIVPVTLQNMLENAIKHNTLDDDDPLRIDIFTEKKYLVVRNNIQRRAIVETSNKQGLDKLRSLYQYLSDKPLKVEEKDGFFAVFIPLI